MSTCDEKTMKKRDYKFSAKVFWQPRSQSLLRRHLESGVDPGNEVGVITDLEDHGGIFVFQDTKEKTMAGS